MYSLVNYFVYSFIQLNIYSFIVLVIWLLFEFSENLGVSFYNYFCWILASWLCCYHMNSKWNSKIKSILKIIDSDDELDIMLLPVIALKMKRTKKKKFGEDKI